MSQHPVDIQELSHKLQNVFPMPQILAKILQLVNDPQASAAALEKVFKYEPSLTLKILSLANSSYYGAPGKVMNIRSAITLLGLNLIKSLAIHASVNELFRFGHVTPIFSGYELWKHSVGVAVCAKMVSRRLKLGNAEDYFTLGILHDVGLIIEYQFFREAFLNVLLRLQDPESNILEAEHALLGFDHAVLTSLLCEKWNMPEHLREVVRCHHAPLVSSEPVRQAAAVIHLSNELVKQSRFGFTYGSPYPNNPAILSLLGLTPVDLDVLQEDFQQDVLETSLLFD